MTVRLVPSVLAFLTAAALLAGPAAAATYPASGQRSARLQAVVSALCDALDS